MLPAAFRRACLIDSSSLVDAVHSNVWNARASSIDASPRRSRNGVPCRSGRVSSAPEHQARWLTTPATSDGDAGRFNRRLRLDGSGP